MDYLKVYEELTTVTLKDWTQVQAPIKIDDLMKACNSWTTFIKLDWVMINTSMIAHAKTNSTTDVEDFIFRQDKNKQQILKEIIKQRQQASLKINVDVLRNAYKSKYGEDLF